MKSVPMCRNNNNNNNNSTGAVSGGRVHRKPRGNDVEDEKIQKYLAKLKDLVPLIPKDKRISRLEVIHHVIDYICDLEDMLENHRSVNADAVHSAAAAVMLSSSVAAVRQPLGIISTPNALAAAAAVAVAAQPQSSAGPTISPASRPQDNKLSNPSDTRAVSC
ncbi:Myc-type, basic helix-loop-helix (bHLH) domain [Cinara cedri]|uniref:Myc-type, basic helix-loop-helix (BHLH) domain n=1 Tax=Cinara cedri TaxID=506608 RepID=A0A5E4LZ34_9HEMI|nr:Myc-type, basic helix-loop-helix (bHLH) domain [Cinara cedri]